METVSITINIPSFLVENLGMILMCWFLSQGLTLTLMIYVVDPDEDDYITLIWMSFLWFLTIFFALTVWWREHNRANHYADYQKLIDDPERKDTFL